MNYRSYFIGLMTLLTLHLIWANVILKSAASSSSRSSRSSNGNSISMQSVDSDACFDSFGERTTKATHVYGESYEKCQHQHRLRRSSTKLRREKAIEREQIENGTAQICLNMQNCSQYEVDEDFFRCHTAVSLDNLDTLINIHLNASAVVIELSEEYEQAEKEVKFCVIEAQRQYSIETRASLKDLQVCLDEVQKNM